MDKNLKRYINDLALTLILGYSKDSCNADIKYSKIKLRMLNAIKNYATLRLKIMQNSKITEIEHTVLKQVFKLAIEQGCKKYNIVLSDDVKTILVDDYFQQLLNFIHELRCDLFIATLSFCERGEKIYESK